MPMPKIFQRKTVVSPVSNLATKVAGITASRQLNDEKLTSMVLATESLDSAQEQALSSVYNNVESNLRTISEDMGYAIEGFQLDAAAVASLLSANPKAALGSKPISQTAMESYSVSRFGVADGAVERPFAMEAYDERDNRNSQVYSIVYNLLASRQDDFGEAFFPTIVVNPNEVGITLSAKIFYAFNDFKRSVTGALANYGRKNIIRAYADADILMNEQTKAVPVYRATGGSDDNTAVFVPSTELAPWSVSLGNGIDLETSALAVGKKIDLIGLSQTNELLNSGMMSASDTLDTYLKLDSVFVKLTDGTATDIVKFDISNLPGSTFTFAPQGNGRKMILNLDSDSIVVTPTFKKVDGANLAALDQFASNSWNGLVRISLSGNVSLDKGDTVINPGSLELIAVRNAVGDLVAGSHADYVAAAALIAGAEIIGYSLTAYRANSNLRQRGQLIDSQVENQVIPVLYRSPISTIAPVIDNGGDDTSSLQRLITVTGVRVSNAAVTALLAAETALKSYVPVADSVGNVPETFGIGRFYVKPAFYTETLAMSSIVDSLKSHERAQDIKAAIVEKLRYYAAEMYRSSQYKAAAMVLSGNIGFKPTIIIGTDPVIYNYIMVDGDLRTLGDQFDVKVVSTLDSRASGKIFMSFGVFDASRNSGVNPLNFGNMLWSPEVTAVLPISRDGQVSRELIVAPRYLHVVHIPILCVLNISGLSAVTSKVSMNQHSV